MSKTVEELIEECKEVLLTKINRIPEEGIIDENGDWFSKADEEQRLKQLLNDLISFVKNHS